uniref:TIR domain-containing protein n=1 Tax=Neogobius melanostomus TaxID=47308 RepID=A0A8C6S844_9GOBI
MQQNAGTLFFLQIILFFNCSLSFSFKNCTIESSEEMKEVLCQSRALTEIPDDIPTNTNVLDMSFNNISEIKRTDLAHLSELVSLIFDHNSLKHIEDKAFANLKELKTLRLSHNRLTNLTDQTFQGLDQLRSLYLHFNRISRVSPHAFQSMTNLHTVDLHQNFIYNVKEVATLFQLPNIEHVSIGLNHITSFDSDDLPLNTTKVKSLGLANNPIRKFSLKRDIFSFLRSIDLVSSTRHIEFDVVNKTFLRSLTEISLGGFYMSIDAYNDMLHYTSLQKITLTALNKDNKSSIIQSACSVPTLKSLRVEYSLLNHIDDHMLSSCSNLTELSFYQANLKEMSEQSLKSLTQIRYLGLAANYLPKVPVTIRGLSTLETLDLSVNYIRELNCLDFVNLTNLKTLSLRKNQIAKVEKCVFQESHSLNRLDMGGNGIHSLDYAFAIKMSRLDTLILSDNSEHLQIKHGDFSTLSSLRVLELHSGTYNLSPGDAFKGLDHLKILTLSINIFTKKLFEGLSQLENLQLHLSFIGNMRDSQNEEPPLSGLPNLKYLSLKLHGQYPVHVTPRPDMLKGLNILQSFTADNFFHALIHPDTFKYTPKLLHLTIINGDFSVLLPELFEPIPNLQRLDLSSNTFRTLDFLANLKSLLRLKVIGNQLSVMNDTLFQTLPALRYLDLTNNPISCECSNVGFKQWVLTNNQTQVINGHQYKCAFPVSQQRHRFLDFDTSSCWIDVGFICFTSSSSLILLVLVVCFVFHFLRFQLVYAYYLFLAHLYDKRKKRGDGHLYDAFISFNVHDEDWVYNEMLPVLEGEQGWRLCLHHRDFEPGKPIVENITDAIYGSRKTICVISRHYLQSEWCSREIQMASVRLFDEKKDVLILVFLEDIPTWQLSPYYQMRRVVKKRTYLSWPQAARHKGVFWQKLNQALNADKNPNDDKHLIIEPEEDH